MKKTAILFLAMFLLGTIVTEAQITNLHSFYDTGSDGAQPFGSLLKAGKVLYGMTRVGGRNTDGNIFSVNTDGTNYKDLWDFHANGTSNGAFPDGSLIMVGNKLFGMTSGGGASADGNIFSINTDGTGYKDLMDFNLTNGAYPYGTLTNVGSKLFGYTYKGGSNDEGVVFSIDTSGNNFKDIVQFSLANGEYPYYGALAASASGKVLYGTTSEGGAHDFGLVYAVDTDGTHFQDLHDFDFTDGESPYGSVTLSGTKLFGTTNIGYPSYSEGVVYTVDTAGKNFKILLGFTASNGENPYGDVAFSGRKVFGMTNEGGANDKGIIFSIDSTGTNFVDVFDFNNTDGENPYGALIVSGGDTLYGMTNLGGSSIYGVVFRFVDAGTGVNNLQTTAGGDINVYPNPNNGQFTIHSSVVSGQSSVEIYNVLGEKVYSLFNIQHSSCNIDLSSQTNGVYLYRVLSEKGELVGEGKLIIQK